MTIRITFDKHNWRLAAGQSTCKYSTRCIYKLTTQQYNNSRTFYNYNIIDMTVIDSNTIKQSAAFRKFGSKARNRNI